MMSKENSELKEKLEQVNNQLKASKENSGAFNTLHTTTVAPSEIQPFKIQTF